MNFEEVSLIISFISFFIIIFLMWQKISLIAELPVFSGGTESGTEKRLLSVLRRGILKILELRHINLLLLAQKILSKIMIFSMKIERVVAVWLQKLREKSKEKKVAEQDHYWKILKRVKDKKDKEGLS